MTTIIIAGTELLQMLCPTKQDLRSKLFMWLLQRIMFSWRQNSSSSYFATQLFRHTRQNRYSTKMYVVQHNTLSDSFRIRIVWFQPKQDADLIRISFFKIRIGSDSKNPLSDYLWWEYPVFLQSFFKTDLQTLQTTTPDKVLAKPCIYCISNFRVSAPSDNAHTFPKLCMSRQGRNKVRWRLGQEVSLASPCSNRRSFGSKCPVLKKVEKTFGGTELEDGVKWEIHPKAFRLTLFKGHRLNEVEIQPNWIIYRKEEISLVKAVANKKGFRR